jgi:GDP-4-dehydro-6-deoxy-D-mannose reductase
VKLLVTGVTGFVGTHLVELLLQEREDVEIYGVVRRGVERVSLPQRVQKIEAEIEHPASVDAVFDVVRPDAVVHLAAQSSVHQSWLDPDGTLRTNLHGTLHVLEALRRRGQKPPMLVVGSADEYGEAEAARLPLREDCPLRPNSPYAVSKVAQGYLALQYALSFRLPVVRTRTFPHTGPGRGESFAESSFAKQLAEIERGLRAPVLEVGNLDAVRDFTDVRDVLRAYWLLMERGQPGEIYNVCSGRGLRIGDLLDLLIRISGRDIEVRVDPQKVRKAEIPEVIGDRSRITAATGWEPDVPLERTLGFLLDGWRARVAASAPPIAPR